MTARTPDTERAAQDAPNRADGHADAQFARTRAFLHEHRLDHMVDEDRAAFARDDEVGPDWAATTRLPTLLAVGGVALAALIAAYLPFAGGVAETRAPDRGGKAALESQVPTNPVPPDAAAPASDPPPARPALPALAAAGADRPDGASGKMAPAVAAAPALAAAGADRPDGATSKVAPAAARAAPAAPPLPALRSRPPPAATAGAAPPDTGALPKPDTAAGDPGALELLVPPVPAQQKAAPAVRSAAPVTTARADDRGSVAPSAGDRQPAPQPVFRLQLVSVSGAPAAHRAWDMYKQDFAGLIGRLEPVIEAAEVGGRMMFRVQAGDFHDRPAAESVCRQLRDQGGIDCFIVTVPSGT
jgi:hypothetical protein